MDNNANKLSNKTELKLEHTVDVVPRPTSFHGLVGSRVSFYWILILKSFMPLPRLVPGSNGTRCHPLICGA